MFKLISVIVLGFLLSGCELRSREEALQKKEALLVEREQNIILKERELEIREGELLKRENLVDSARDTTYYNPALIGDWSVKMTCTETTCPGSAVGDTKSETWSLSYQNNQVIARAKEGDKLVRVYTGQFNGDIIELKEDVAHTNITPATLLKVRLNIINPTTMEGDREIIRQNECKIVYRVELSKL